MGYRKNSDSIVKSETKEEEIKQIAKAICDKSCSCDKCRESSYAGYTIENYCYQFEYAQMIYSAGCK